jgi:hypothetical protein
MMKIVEPLSQSNKKNNTIDLYFLFEGFKYTLREWRRWTHCEILIDDCILTRGEYSTSFINFIITLLDKNGYILKYSSDSIVRRFMHYWLQLYNSNGSIPILPIQYNNKINFEYEEWNRTFTYDFWENITKEWIVYIGFDDTNIGRQLLYNIGDFFWNYIDFNKSPKIIEKYEEDRKIQEELNNLIEEQYKYNKIINPSATITSKDKNDEVNDKEYW